MHRAGAGVYLVYEFLSVAAKERLCIKTYGYIFFPCVPGNYFCHLFLYITHCRLLLVIQQQLSSSQKHSKQW